MVVYSDNIVVVIINCGYNNSIKKRCHSLIVFNIPETVKIVSEIFAKYCSIYRPEENKLNFSDDCLEYISGIEKIVKFNIPFDLNKIITNDVIKKEIFSIIFNVKNNKESALEEIQTWLCSKYILTVELNILIGFLSINNLDFNEIRKLTPLEFVKIIGKNMGFRGNLLDFLFFDAITKELMDRSIQILNGEIFLHWRIGDRGYTYSNSDKNVLPKLMDGKMADKLGFDRKDYVIGLGSKILDVYNNILIKNALNYGFVNTTLTYKS